MAKEPPELCSEQPAFHRNSRPGGRDQGGVWGEAVQRHSLGALRMEAVKRQVPPNVFGNLEDLKEIGNREK